MIRSGRAFVLPLAVAVGVSGIAPRPDITWRNVVCSDRSFRYIIETPGNALPGPAIVLLHGAGDRPDPMVAAWRSLARAEGIVLIAPEMPRVEWFEPMAPAVFRCMVEDAKRTAAIDPRRVYLFGHSMGGYLAYDAAMLESRYFAAAAIHAMGIAREYDWIVDSARRKVPIAIYIGDRDPLVPLASLRRTRDLLLARGFPVHYVELNDHDHDYYARSQLINADAWKFLKQQRIGVDRP